MRHLPKAIRQLIGQFEKLPGLGPKTSEKLVYSLLSRPKEDLETFAQTLVQAKEQIIVCPLCFNYADSIPCSICQDPNREKDILCVVAGSQDVQAIEKTDQYHGLYHVLQGHIDPNEGRQLGQLRVKELQERIKKNSVKEIILALNNDLLGETTSLYLVNLLKNSPPKISRLAKGLPSGSEIEYADDVTLGYALKDRKEI
ncbi:MAG: recombination protein RecR [Candidatus Komeilibacteria bacterium CG_4_10_14_0_2_um_filter_37_10]|uniref:Recombination protein RecR n=1 Tax=Candidatus Komeilibacteria bacterium CG_4_10_14_0_2_um_filter_37_10 TaxID=1974470 RepID=A0A2M7VGF6_9BACT|nr:MAG: recombination protein RecR [Candidatus Komeilibacteria bacterium CG_4_10_14_0_2_um_filter_37_10]